MMSGRQYLQSFGLVFYAATGLFLFVFTNPLSGLDLYPICVASTGFLALALAYTHWTRERRIWSISGVYLVVFSLFHCGLVLVFALRMEIGTEFVSYLNKWLYSVDTKTAIILVMLAVCSYQFGVTLSSFWGQNSTPPTDNPAKRVIPVIGFILVASSFAVWAAMVVLHGGIGLFGGSYSEYRESTPGSLNGWLYFFIGVGLVYLAISPACRWRRLGLAIFALFSVLAMGLGLRGEVLFPTFSALAVYGMKKYPISITKAALLAFVLLTTIAAVRQMRQVGFLEYQFSLAALAPANALAEMGASIRPVMEVVSWVRAGDEFMQGRSYWAPIDRVLVYLVPGWERPPLQEDDRILGQTIGRRAGAVGFSTIAEAYYNFGRWGVAAYMFLLGLLFGRMEQWPPDPHRQLAAGVVLFLFMIQIRNTFIFVPVSLVIGLVLVYITSLIGKSVAAGEARRTSDGTALRPRSPI
ncbi:MAG: O-antigen polysaccharide polymerase Wzy [Desulfuromonadales bacterium]|nr:O-antigen polysaccharide polymerase Wzy [Desulfuromonadales bacterium]